MENKEEPKVESPWDMEWVKKPFQAVTQFVEETVKGLKEPWEMPWKEKATAPSPTPVKPAVAPSKGFDMDSYITKTAAVESGGNPNAKAKTSSAKGLFQFTAGTWNEMVDKLELPYTLADRTDPKKSEEVMRKFTEKNVVKAKEVLGREPTQLDAYMFHFLGNSAPKFLKADGRELAYKQVTAAQARANKAVFFNKDGTPKTVNEVVERYSERFK